jgi:hypothetical protein
MSLATLADDEILRTDRSNILVTPIIDANLQSVMAALNLDAGAEPALRRAMRPVAAASPIQKTSGSNALDAITKYIPTESVTLYVAATAALSSLGASFSFVTPFTLYCGFVVLTPILFALIYVGKRRSQNLTPPFPDLSKWPWWKLIASTIAFMVWALAIPPLVTTDAGKIAAAFGVLLVSTLLSLVGAVVERPEAA